MPVNRRDFIKAAAAGSISLFALGNIPNINFTKRKDKPNLLFIITDEQRADTMKAYGNSFLKVPNLNKLASESIVFENHYVTQPVCTPSRASMITGLYPHQTGATNDNIPLPKNIPDLVELISDPDYRTAHFGDWDLGDEIFAQRGFTEWAATEDSYTRYYSKGRDRHARSAYYHWLISKGVKPPDNATKFSRSFTSHLPLELSKPRFLQLKTIDFLKRNKDNPFILNVSFLQPHPPFYGPFNNFYRPEDIMLSPNVGVPVGEDEPLLYRLRSSAEKRSMEEWRKLTALYYGLITEVDKSIGAILDTLEFLGLKENTIVVFTSDHGDMMGSHDLIYKRAMYQEAVKVPLLIRDPGRRFRQIKVDHPVSNVSIVPTLLKAMKVKNPDYDRLPGYPLTNLIDGGSIKEKDVFIEWTPNYLKTPSKRVPYSIRSIPKERYEEITVECIRTVISPDGWKLCLSDNDKNQLFNLKKDPYEFHNLYYKNNYGKKTSELKRKIYDWQRRTWDTLKL